MNIFRLDIDLRKNAEFHVDSHLGKIQTEAAQLLSAAVWKHSPVIGHYLTAQGHCYKPSHLHHPLTGWVAESQSNYNCTVNYILALAEELRFRFPHYKIRRDVDVTLYLADYLWLLPPGPSTPQPITTGNCFATADNEPTSDRASADLVASYRRYYSEHKSHLHKWTNRPAPHWLCN